MARIPASVRGHFPNRARDQNHFSGASRQNSDFELFAQQLHGVLLFALFLCLWHEFLFLYDLKRRNFVFSFSLSLSESRRPSNFK